MNAVLASRQQRAPRDANEARALHLISRIEGQLARWQEALLAGEPSEILGAACNVQPLFAELLARTVPMGVDR